LGAKAFFERALAYADGERAKLILTVLEGLPESANRVRVKPETVAPIEVKPALTTREVVVTVTADPALTLKPNATIYVFAKAVSGPPMPLAVVKHKASELPLQVVLDESMSMMAGLSIAEFDRIIVTAKISESGLATSSPDDLVTESAPLEFDQNKIKVSLVLRAGI
jgi:cytochrome c-type biogenesis protein CcmH